MAGLLKNAAVPDAQRTAWGWRALQFTPRVAQVDEALVLEVSGSHRLWGGADRLLRRLFRPKQAAARVEYAQAAIKSIVVADALWAGISALESPARMGFVLDLPAPAGIEPLAPSVLLDRVQDAGNVGSILRSAAAFGFRQVLALKGTAALWSPKVLRAGMGAHFGLRLIEAVEPAALDALAVPVITIRLSSGRMAALPTPWRQSIARRSRCTGPRAQ